MVKFYSVVEEQHYENDTTTVLAWAFDNYNAALSKYYTVLAAAAVSTIPYHAAYILEANKGVRECKFFDRSDLPKEETAE